MARSMIPAWRSVRHRPEWLRVARIALTLGALAALPTAAAAISPERLKRLSLVVEGGGPSGGMVTLEKVGTYLAALKKAGHVCELSTYAYGGGIVCRTRAGKQVLLDLEAIPTRAPEFANVGSVRPDGVNSTPLPKTDVPAFLATLKVR